VRQYDPVAFPHTFVCDFDDDGAVRRIAEWILRVHAVRGIAAYHEKSLILAAELRTKFGLPGMSLTTATLVRDKARMKAAVARVGIPVAEHRTVDDVSDLNQLDWAHGPYVLKNRLGVGSQFQGLVATAAQAADIVTTVPSPPGGWLAERYVDAGMIHCDAVVVGSKVVFCCVSHYLTLPGDFRIAAFGGSEVIPSGELYSELEQFNAAVIRALGIVDGVTHLEVFRGSDGRLTFCEIAARPPGGGIDLLVHRACGVNLFEAAIRLSAGLTYDLPMSAHPPTQAWAVVQHDRLSRLDPRSGPRHSADYTDLFILHAGTTTELRRRVAALRALLPGGV
jgi:biotin carboxylase